MPSIPASGPISMSMFNTILGRASNTSNSSLAGGTTPAVGSQFYLGGQSGSLNQTAPHAMSEWYGYTPVSNITITICAKYGNDPTGETITNYGFYYASSSDGVIYSADSLILNGQNITTTCDCTDITVPQNYYGAFGFKKISDNSGRYFTGTKLGGTCPAQSADYCGTAGTGDSPYVTSWSTTGFSIYFTIFVNVKAGSVFEAC